MASDRSATTLSQSWSRGARHRCWRTACRVAIGLPSYFRNASWSRAIFGVGPAAGVRAVNSVSRAQQIHHIVEETPARVLVICSRALFTSYRELWRGFERLSTLLRRSRSPIDGTATAAVAGRDQAIERGSRHHSLHVRSTGGPKGVMLSHARSARGSRIVIQYLSHDRDRVCRSCRSASTTASINCRRRSTARPHRPVHFSARRRNRPRHSRPRHHGAGGRPDHLGDPRPRPRPCSARPNFRPCATSPIPAARSLRNGAAAA